MISHETNTEQWQELESAAVLIGVCVLAGAACLVASVESKWRLHEPDCS